MNRPAPFTLNHLASPATVKLEAVAKGIDPRTTYRAVIGAEDCPVCFTRGASSRLRRERHHNADAWVLLCGGCGLSLVI